MNPRRARRRSRTARNRLRQRVATAVSLAAAQCLPEVARSGSPERARTTQRKHVNWGWCEDVALGAQHHLEGWGIRARTLCDDEDLRVPYLDPESDSYPPDHWWLWVPALGTHHDAEAPLGVECWTHLPLFLRHEGFDPGSVRRVVPLRRQRFELDFNDFVLRKCLAEIQLAREAKRVAVPQTWPPAGWTNADPPGSYHR